MSGPTLPADDGAAEAAAPATLRIELLRQAALTRNGTRLLTLSRKDAALLAVLALDGQAARDTLAEMLWPGAAGGATGLAGARANLRQRRFRLAKAAGRALIDGEHLLSLAPGAAVNLQSLDDQLVADASALQGDLLEGWTYADCPDLDRWLSAARERWRVMRQQALARAASRLETASRLAPALALAQRLCTEEPLSDHTHRRLMRLHHLRGDLGAALEVYRRFAQRLDAELGELPDDETAGLAAQLRLGQGPPRAARPLPPGLQRPPRLVGRDADWQTLQRAWDAPAHVLLQGAPGMGKTRLLADFLQGRPGCLQLGALPGDADRPYALLARLLSALWFDANAPWPEGPATLPQWARRELAALLPELGSGPPRLDPLRLQRALGAALKPPPGAPALQCLALDDVQQADAASLELLPALAGSPTPAATGTPASMRWWLALRQGEQHPALADWLAASHAPRALLLQPLDRQALQTLLRDVASDRVQPDAGWLQRYSGGNPLFVLETLRSLHEHAGVAGRWTAGAVPDTGADPALPPAAAAARVQGRLRQLPEAARQLAAALAVLQTPVELAEGASLLGSTPAALLDAYGQLQAAHWLDDSGRMHDLVRQSVLAAQPAPVRRWLHARAATHLAPRGAAPQELARHWLQAGSPERAGPLFQQAALAARRSARPREEAGLWDESIAAYEAARQPQQASAAWRESIEARLFSVGPKALLAPTAARLQQAGDPRARLDALLAHADVQVLLAEATQVRALTAEAAALARQLGDAAAEVKAGLLMAGWLAQRGDFDEALATTDRLAPLLAAVPDRRYPWLSTRSFALHRAGRLSECAAVLDQAAPIAEANNDLMELCTTRSNMASLLVSLGRHRQALAAVESALRARAQLGPASGVHHANIDLTHGYVLAGLGRPASAIAAMERARDAFATSDSLGTWQIIAGNALAAVELARDAAATALQRLHPPPVADTPGFVAARHHLLQARALRALGRSARPALARATAVLQAQCDPLQSLLLQAERLDDDPPAQAAPALAALQGQLLAVEQGAQAARLGWLAVQRWLHAGEWAAAATHLRTLLLPGTPHPMDLLPSRQWALAQQVLSAVGDAPAARRAQQRERAALLRERDDAVAAQRAAETTAAAATAGC